MMAFSAALEPLRSANRVSERRLWSALGLEPAQFAPTHRIHHLLQRLEIHTRYGIESPKLVEIIRLMENCRTRR